MPFLRKLFFYNHSFVNKPLSMTKRQRGCYIIKNSVQVRPCAYELWLVCVSRRGNKPLSPVKTLSVCMRVRVRVCVCVPLTLSPVGTEMGVLLQL